MTPHHTDRARHAEHPDGNERLRRRHRLPVMIAAPGGGMTVVRADPGPDGLTGPGVTPGGRRSRARFVPHSHRIPPRQPNPATGRMWPPRGWTPEALAAFRVQVDRTRQVLLTWGAAQHSPAYAGRLDAAEARVREAAQFGATPEDAAAALRAAHQALLDVRAWGRADTRPLTLPRPPLPTDRPERRPDPDEENR